MNSATTPSGSLAGATILRFVRGYAHGAGLEYDVAMINQALCCRHDVHIIQIHMARSGDPLEATSIKLHQGVLTSIPLLRDVLPVSNSDSSWKSKLQRFKHLFRDSVIFNPISGPWLAKQIASVRPRTKPGDVPGVGAAIRKVLSQHKIDFAYVHAAGGSDAWEAIHVLRSAGIPVGMQLHFANERFLDFSVRVQTTMVHAVGGVSDVNVPPYLASKFSNLLTGVDLQFFKRENAASSPFSSKRPIVVLPARIVPTKGHDDIVDVVQLLRQRGLEVDVVFAGRADQPEYEKSLRARITAAGLADSFHFLGLLNQEQLRNLYSACQLLAFPTYHQEGLPRILLEAQAMGLPVVVYDTGGSRAGLVPGKTGHLVATGDKIGMAQAIELLLTNPSQAKAFAKSGRDFLETNFDLDALADRHERFIKNTMKIAQEWKPAPAIASDR